ncbi:hypothetical protein [Clostridium formicaceticum]|uniref:Uncharacterized protein n=1 Tax=Clostridium formicaceticum TaxID=1497 RepID=A0AAC9WGJ5_9CLOT|nr:hypothetical protein [Clostridium formicaceticum]AOY77460.1 hypothetical protein BJL90_17330 [Clostridium formicaceticum]ARE88018.1 hypothetical protein CLFO_24190 [Clostridium formicaceticum]
MAINDHPANQWIKIKTRKKHRNAPSEIQINMDGTVYMDGVPYDEANSKYKTLSVDVENHNRFNVGEETEKIIEARKKMKKGDSVTIKDVKGPDRKESTTVKF